MDNAVIIPFRGAPSVFSLYNKALTDRRENSQLLFLLDQPAVRHSGRSVTGLCLPGKGVLSGILFGRRRSCCMGAITGGVF